MTLWKYYKCAHVEDSVWIQCIFVTVLPIRLKIFKSLFFLFTRQNVRFVWRFGLPSTTDWPWAYNPGLYVLKKVISYVSSFDKFLLVDNTKQLTQWHIKNPVEYLWRSFCVKCVFVTDEFQMLKCSTFCAIDIWPFDH